MRPFNRIAAPIAAAMLAAAALAGCAARDAIFETPPAGYVADAAARTAGVDWSRAETVAVTLSEYAFAPAEIAFEAGKPYRLRIENAGATTHTFVSEGFFQAIAAARLTNGDAAVSTPYVKTIAVAPGTVRELDFVAVRSGVFRLECTVPGHALFGMTGAIAVR